MQDLEFQKYLSKKTDIELAIIKDLFENAREGEFDVALKLIEVYGIDKATLGKLWGSYIGFAYVDPNMSIVNPELIKKVGADFILKNRALPLYKFGRAVTVSTCNPTNPFIQDKLEKKLEDLVSFVFCFPFDIKTYLKNSIPK